MCMQGRGEKDLKAVAEIYSQLDAQFDEDEKPIRCVLRCVPSCVGVLLLGAG